MLNVEINTVAAVPAILYDRASIERVLCHRAYALFVDSATVNGWHVEASACWDGTHPHLAGHFPDMPVVPGVFLIEAAAQAIGLVLASTQADCIANDRMAVLAGVRSCRLHEMVRPGETVLFELDVESRVPDTYFEAVGAGYLANGTKAINLEISVATVPREDVAAGSQVARPG